MKAIFRYRLLSVLGIIVCIAGALTLSFIKHNVVGLVVLVIGVGLILLQIPFTAAGYRDAAKRPGGRSITPRPVLRGVIRTGIAATIALLLAAGAAAFTGQTLLAVGAVCAAALACGLWMGSWWLLGHNRERSS